MRSPPRSRQLILLSVLFIGAGVLHFIFPARYAAIVPAALPYPVALVYLSGVAQIAGGVGVLIPPLRRAAGWGLIALLVAIFPANVQMLVSAERANASRWALILLVARLPLQALLIAWVWRVTRRHRWPQRPATG